MVKKKNKSEIFWSSLQKSILLSTVVSTPLFSGFSHGELEHSQCYSQKPHAIAFTSKNELLKPSSAARIHFSKKNKGVFPKSESIIGFRYNREGDIEGFTIKEPGYYEISYGVSIPEQDHQFAVVDVTDGVSILISGSLVSGVANTDKTEIKTIVAIPEVPKDFEIQNRSENPVTLSTSNSKKPVTSYFKVTKLD